MRFSTPTLRRLAATAAICTFALTGCADYTNPQALREGDMEKADPMEGFNRAMFDVNTALDKVLIRPVAYVYREVVPENGRTAVSNFLKNLSAPVVLANSVMQGDQENSFATFWRFVINTTVGIGGLFDVAGHAGLKNRDADFGQTMAVWGVNSGPYVVLPIFGPGTLRDQFGTGVDILINPVTWSHEDWHSIAQGAMTVVDKRAQYFTAINDVYRTSLDPYATFRSGYFQRRVREIKQGKAHYQPRSVVEKPVSAPPQPVSAKITGGN